MDRKRGPLGKEGFDVEDEREKILHRVNAYPVLDVGTGNGWLAIRAARDYGIELLSIDCDKVKLENAKRNAVNEGVAGKIGFIRMDACDMCFPDDYFGTVMAYQIIHHSLYPFRVVDEMFRVCRRGGVVIMSDLSREGFEGYAGIYHSFPGERGKQEQSADPVNIRQLWEYLQEKSSRVHVEEHGFTSLIFCEK